MNSINTINEKISACHNTKLIDVSMAPNENTIYHIYTDGEITQQKGSYAYMQRSEITIETAVQYKYVFNFPNKNRFNVGYAIVTKEDAIAIRDMMKKIEI